VSDFSSFRNGDEAFEFEDLLEEGPIEKVIELAAGGQGADFEPAVTFAGDGYRTKVFGWRAHARQEFNIQVKPILQILEQLRLIAFHRP
jgi:hypothetical protein